MNSITQGGLLALEHYGASNPVVVHDGLGVAVIRFEFAEATFRLTLTGVPSAPVATLEADGAQGKTHAYRLAKGQFAQTLAMIVAGVCPRCTGSGRFVRGGKDLGSCFTCKGSGKVELPFPKLVKKAAPKKAAPKKAVAKKAPVVQQPELA